MCVCVWMQREVQRAQEDALSWLTARLEVLEELCPDAEAVTRRMALDELAHALTTLLSSLDEVRTSRVRLVLRSGADGTA